MKRQLLLSVFVIGSLSLLSACGKLNSGAQQSDCMMADGTDAACSSPGAVPRTAQGAKVGSCGPDFSHVYQAALSAESGLDIQIARCPNMTCSSAIRGQLRASAITTERAANSLNLKYPNSTCTGRFVGGSKAVDGPISTKDEFVRLTNKHSKYH